MDSLEQISTLLALSMGVAWASGINLYAALLVLGLLGSSGHLALPETLQILQHPVVLGAAGFMYLVEFFADKFPGVDNLWDTLHTFVRIPAGAILAASVVGQVDPAISLAVAILGGGMAAGTHLTKMSARMFVNTSPEPFSNIGVSLFEDFTVLGALWLAFMHPWLFLVFLLFFLLFLVWFLPIIWRGLKFIASTLGRFFQSRKSYCEISEE